MKRFGLILAAFLGLAAQALPASADALFTLNQGGGAFTTPGNYGTVNLHNVGTGSSAYVTVTVTLTGGAKFAGTGAGYAIAWNITGNPALSAVNITSPNAANFTVQNFTSGQGYKASPFTSSFTDFMYAIDYIPNGSTGNDTSLVFDVKASGGLTLSNFTFNSGAFRFAADISKSGVTGNVAAKGDGVTTTSVPEPGSLLLVATGIGGLVASRRRKKAKAA